MQLVSRWPLVLLGLALGVAGGLWGCNPAESPKAADASRIHPPAVAVSSPATQPNPVMEGFTPVEQFGAQAFYTHDQFYGTLTLTPLPRENQTLVTYTGSGDPFDASWGQRRVEFVAFRAHRNSLEYPPNGVVNGNYFPGMISCRYSRVVQVLDGKNLKVDFVYNGGNRQQPQITPKAYGYFFIDNRAAFARAFGAQEPANRIQLREGQTYVCKGGWDVTVEKNLLIKAPGKAAIKISMEDAFLVGPNMEDPATLVDLDRASYLTTYGSQRFFVFPDNTHFDVRLENIDLLPPHYTAPNSGLDSGTCGPIFTHPSAQDYKTNLQGRWIHGKRELVNCDNQAEAKKYAGVAFPKEPWFFGGTLCVSNDGGKLNADSTDIEHYQEFNFFDVEWFGREPMGLRSVSRAGNIFRHVNQTRKKLHAGNAQTNVDQYTAVIRFKADAQGGQDRGLRLMELIDGSVTAYQLASTTYWAQWGHLAYSDGDPRRRGRIQYADPANKCTWYLSFPTPAHFVRDYPETEAFNPNNFRDKCRPYADAVTLRTFEMIPVSDSPQARAWNLKPTTITVDGQLNRKLSDTQFVFEQYAFQAPTSYSYLVGNGEKRGDASHRPDIETYPTGDELQYADPADGNAVKTVKIIKRYRHSRSPANAKFAAIPYWVYEFDQPVKLDKPTFTVKKSVLEFALNPQGVPAVIRIYLGGTSPSGIQWQYLCYSSKSLNWEMQNSDIRAYLRVSDHNQPVRTASDPLWTMSIIKSWKAVTIDGSSGELWGQNTLKARRDKTGDARYMAIVDNADLGAGPGNMPSPSGQVQVPND